MYATIKNGVAEYHEGVPTLEQMQAIVGGFIETAERVGTTRPGIMIGIYCNEDGIGLSLPLTYHNSYGSPIFGDLVLVAENDRSGNTVKATKRELQAAVMMTGI